MEKIEWRERQGKKTVKKLSEKKESMTKIVFPSNLQSKLFGFCKKNVCHIGLLHSSRVVQYFVEVGNIKQCQNVRQKVDILIVHMKMYVGRDFAN
jgi:hypothetical protein